MLAISIGITLAVMALVNVTTGDTQSAHPEASQPLLDMSAKAADTNAPAKLWAASATGRIESRTGEHRLGALQARRIADVIVATHDQVKSGDLLIRLDDTDLYAKRSSALAEVQVRLRERADEPVTGLALERQKVEDSLATTERALFTTREDFDAAQSKRRQGSGTENDETAARNWLLVAEKDVAEQHRALEKITAKSDMPFPTRLDTGLIQARSDLLLIENAIENTRIRAPFDGNILNVWAKVGEIASPSPTAPLVLFGDTSAMRVRAELEERDVVKVRVGQKVIVRTDAHPGQDFVGKVVSLGGAFGRRNITSRGPRRPNDVDVLEVVCDLGPQPTLLPGMRVDVFFVSDETAQSSTATKTQ